MNKHKDEKKILWDFSPFDYRNNLYFASLAVFSEEIDINKLKQLNPIYILDISYVNLDFQALIIDESGLAYVSSLSTEEVLLAINEQTALLYDYSYWEACLNQYTDPGLIMLPHLGHKGFYLRIEQTDTRRSDWLNLSLCERIQCKISNDNAQLIHLYFDYPSAEQKSLRFRLFHNAYSLLKQCHIGFHTCFAWYHYLYLSLLGKTFKPIFSQEDIKFIWLNHVTEQHEEIYRSLSQTSSSPRDSFKQIACYFTFFYNLPAIGDHYINPQEVYHCLRRFIHFKNKNPRTH